ncbi:hypothetical protein F9S84_25885, partial [Escherichia coli]|nr:hypothetical protein [Escherichia coli]
MPLLNLTSCYLLPFIYFRNSVVWALCCAHFYTKRIEWFLTQKIVIKCKQLTRTVLIFTERSVQLSKATGRVPGLPASP